MATSIIEKLNGLVDKTPDQIAANLSDPLNHWQSMPETITREFYDKHKSRIIAMWHEREGYYTTHHEFFTYSYSYRTRDVAQTTVQNMRTYEPQSARDCPGWWFIGFEHRDTPLPCPTSSSV